MSRRRILVVDYSAAQTRGPNAASMYAELGKRFDLTVLSLPPAPWIVRIRAAAATFSRNRVRWSADYWQLLEKYRFTPHSYRKTTAAYTRAVDKAVRQRPADLILQYGALFGPTGTAPCPYITYHDGNMGLTRASLSHQARYQTPEEFREFFELERRLVCGAARVLTYSTRTRDSYVRDYGCHPDLVHAVGSSDWVRTTDRVWLEPLLHRDVSASFPERKDGLALFVYSEFERKGGEILMQAFRTVLDSFPKARLVTVGPPRSELASAKHIEQAGVIRDREKLFSLYRRASLFVLPSLNDPFPRVLFEAMLHALPCVATNVGGIPEQVLEGRTGHLVQPGDAEQLARAMVRVLSDPEHGRALGRNGRQHLEDFLPARVASRVAQRIEEVI